jgi:IS5 family transposase
MVKHRRSHPQTVKKARTTRYRVQNWPKYDRALARRGSVTIWFDPRLTQRWRHAQQPPGKRGAPFHYRPALMVCMLTLKAVYHLSNRETEGLMRSLLRLMGPARRVPDHTTLSRRGRQLKVPLASLPARGPVHLLLDSSGLQIQGVSPWREWQQARWRKAQAGRQDFRKIHLAVNADAQEFVAVELTDKFEHDKNLVEALLQPVADPIGQVTADGNYDFDTCREAIRARGARDLIPPRANAVIDPRHPRPERDAALRQIARLGSRKAWKKRVGYHRRSLIETAFSRLKRRLGQRLSSREKSRQITEANIWCRVMNALTQLGLPDTVPIGTA